MTFGLMSTEKVMQGVPLLLHRDRSPTGVVMPCTYTDVWFSVCF